MRKVMLMIVALSGVCSGAPTQAQELFENGAASYRRHNFISAAAAFLEAYKLSKMEDLLYDAAVAFDEGGAYRSAIVYYRQYLVAGGSDPVASQRYMELVKTEGHQ